MEPDSVVFSDIYLQEDLITGIFSPSTKNNPVRVYPNPLSANEKLSVEIDLPVLTADIRVDDDKFCLRLMSWRRKIVQERSNNLFPERSGYNNHLVIINGFYLKC